MSFGSKPETGAARISGIEEAGVEEMFTVKYQSFQPAAAQSETGPTNYDRCEQIHGPFGLVSQEMADGYVVVHAHRGGDSLGMTFGPNRSPDPVDGAGPPPRSTIWVMNESGATVATYYL